MAGYNTPSVFTSSTVGKTNFYGNESRLFLEPPAFQKSRTQNRRERSMVQTDSAGAPSCETVLCTDGHFLQECGTAYSCTRA